MLGARVPPVPFLFSIRAKNKWFSENIIEQILFSFIFSRAFVEGGRHIGSAARRELDLVKLGLFHSRPPPPSPGIFLNPSSSPLKSYFCLPQHSLSLFVQDPNRPFPSSCLLSLQSEYKCEVFVMVISSTLHMNEN